MATCPAGHASADDQFCEVCGLPIGAAPIYVGAEAPPAGPGQQQATVAGPVPGEPCPRCAAPRTGNFCESCGWDFAAAGPDTLDPVVYRSAPPLPGPYAPAAPPAPLPPTSVLPSSAVLPPPPARSASAGPEGYPGPGAYPPPSAPARPAAGPSPDGEWTAVVSADRAYYEAVQAEGGPDAAAIAFPAYFPQRRFRLVGTEMRIGRHSASSGIDPEIDLAVPPADPGVSRLHAVLLRSPDGTWSVVDPGSANGTAVNGSEIPPNQPVPLVDGDRIHLGAWTELRVVRGA